MDGSTHDQRLCQASHSGRHQHTGEAILEFIPVDNVSHSRCGSDCTRELSSPVSWARRCPGTVSSATTSRSPISLSRPARRGISTLARRPSSEYWKARFEYNGPPYKHPNRRSRFLSKRDGFDFEIKERDGVRSPHPDLPKSFFLTNYKHPSAAPTADLEANIEAAMQEIMAGEEGEVDNDTET